MAIGENPLLNQANVIDFQAGVIFTGNEAFVTFQPINIYANPEFLPNQINRIFSVWTYRFIVIVGKHFLRATTADDFRITITDKACEINFINATYISCLLPLTPPAKDSGNYSTVRAYVGNHVTVLGRIWYRVPIFANVTNLPVITFTHADYQSRISVNGEGVMVGMTSRDYEVWVGQEVCVDIVVTPTSLSCRGPLLSPLPTSTLTQHPSNYPQLLIIVPRTNKGAFHYRYHAAYVRYTNFDYSNSSPVLTDTQGQGVIPVPNNNNDDVNTFEIHKSASDEDDDVVDDMMLWIVIGLIGAFTALLLALLCCCCCCPCCGMTRPRRKYEEETRYVFNDGFSWQAPDRAAVAVGGDRVVLEERLTPVSGFNRGRRRSYVI